MTFRSCSKLAAISAVQLICALSVAAQAPAPAPPGVPNRKDSVKFAAIGDNGTGDPPQYEVGRQMDVWHAKFPFDFVIMLGDNLYGSQQPRTS